MRYRSGISTVAVVAVIIVIVIIAVGVYLLVSPGSAGTTTTTTGTSSSSIASTSSSTMSVLVSSSPSSTTSSSTTTSASFSASSMSSSSSSTSGSTINASANDQALYQVARTEGTVTVYGSPSADQFSVIANDFMHKYPGVTVQYTSLQPPQAVQRINAELGTQNHTADMVLQATTTIYPLELSHLVMPYVSPYASAFPKDVLDPLNGSTPVIELAIGWIYNPTVVPSAQAPTTMSQVASSQWKDQIIMNDPTTGTAFTQYWASLEGVLGNSTVINFLQQLKANTDPTVVPTTTSCANDVASGAHAICVAGYMQEAAPDIQNGAPIKFLNITGVPLLITPSNAALVKNAQHPDAAKLLADYMASPEGQTAWGNIDVRTPVSQTVTAKWSLTSEIKQFDPGASNLVYFPTPAVASAATAWATVYAGIFKA